MGKKMRIGKYVAVSLSIVAAPMIAWAGNGVSATVPYVNERIDVDSVGNQISPSSLYTTPKISQDGRYVAFMSGSNQLVSGDTNGLEDIFVKDRQTGGIVRANTSSTGAQMVSGGIYEGPWMSDNGRFVAFTARKPDLVAGYAGTISYRDLYVKDLQTGVIEVASVSSGGSYGDANTTMAALSADGRYITFRSLADNLVSGDTNAKEDIFVRDRLLGTTTLVSKSYTGGISNGSSSSPTISCDGAYIAFSSAASDLVTGDTNGRIDTFLVDRIAGTTRDVTINGNNTSDAPQLSCDGSTLIFSSSATTLISGDSNGYKDIFAYNIYDNSFERVDVSSGGSQSGNNVQTNLMAHSVSYDGNLVVFHAYDSAGLASGDTNLVDDIFLRNRKAATTEVVSKRSSSTQTTGASYEPSVSDDGKYIVYFSDDSGLVSGDTNGQLDVIVSKTGI